MTAEAAQPLAHPSQSGPSRGGETSRFLALDGLRGIAAFSVILDHVPPEMTYGLLPGRALSVDFFFILSGFVLAHAYGERLMTGLSPLAFMRVRIIRLYPLYLLGLLIALASAAYMIRRGWWDVSDISTAALLGFVFLPTPPPASSQLYPLNPPAWSLLFELIANLVYALTARFLSLRLLAWVLPVGAAAVVFTTFRHADVTGPGWEWSHFDAGLARVMFDFFAGVFLYRLRETWRAPVMPSWLAVVVFLAIIGVPAPSAWRPAFDSGAAIILFPLLVMTAADARVSGAMARVCTTLGLMSYAVYVLHVPLRGVLNLVFDRIGFHPPGYVFVGTLMLTAALAALLADRLYDTPVRRWLMARLVRRKPVTSRPEGG